jgi:glycosyltransferase involved in cell wall biosynthesis
MAQNPSLPTAVILVDHGYVSGGQSKVAIESALGLAKAGVRTIFFAACGPLDPRLAEGGVETVCLDQYDILNNPSRGAAALQGTWNRKAAETLDELLAGLPRENTIVHMHGWAKAISPSVSGPIRKSGLPAAYTMHEYFLVCPNGGLYDFQKDEVCRLEPMSLACWASHCDSRNYPFKLWRNARLAVAQVAGLGDCFSDFLLISDLEERLLEGRLPKGAAAHRVCNPVEVAPLGQKTTPASGDMIFVGRLSAEKGAPLFAKAARLAGVAPVFIGDGPIAGDLSRDFPEAKFLGWRSPHEVRAALRAARVLVFPSLWYETLGLSPLEAKGLGTPAIVSDVCAAKDEIADGIEGLWFRSGDVAALAATLDKMKDDPLVTRLSRAAYDGYWRNPPTLERHVAETLRVYEQMLARRTKR